METKQCAVSIYTYSHSHTHLHVSSAYYILVQVDVLTSLHAAGDGAVMSTVLLSSLVKKVNLLRHCIDITRVYTTSVQW